MGEGKECCPSDKQGKDESCCAKKSCCPGKKLWLLLAVVAVAVAAGFVMCKLLGICPVK